VQSQGTGTGQQGDSNSWIHVKTPDAQKHPIPSALEAEPPIRFGPLFTLDFSFHHHPLTNALAFRLILAVATNSQPRPWPQADHYERSTS
jgi:hypothetical protein